VFPSMLYGVGRPNLATGRATCTQGWFPDTGGWRQDALHAALLGLTESAAFFVTKNFNDGNTTSARFKGFWWAPDDSRIAVQRFDDAPLGIVTRAAIGADGTRTLEQRYPVAG